LPVADELAKRGIPFIFATGYGDAATVPERFSSVPLIVKPYSQNSLINAISKAVGKNT
jgi:FixJ family two-component response regulator